MKKINLFISGIFIALGLSGCGRPTVINQNVTPLLEKNKNSYPLRLKVLKDSTCKIIYNSFSNSTSLIQKYEFKKEQEFSGHSLKGKKIRNEFEIPKYAVAFLIGDNLYMLLQESGEELYTDKKKKFITITSSSNGTYIDYLANIDSLNNKFSIDCPLEYTIIKD